jgi:protein deglycase
MSDGASEREVVSRTVLVPVADGTEELEAVAIVDTLRRAGAAVTVASVTGAHQVTGSRRVRLVADALIDDVASQRFDLIALPGGLPGAQALRESTTLQRLLAAQVADGRLLGAVCAAPAVVLEPLGLLGGRLVTAHPSVFERLPAATRREERVVIDAGLVTSRGAGTAVEFALALVEQLYGADQRAEVARGMVAH